ncbi:BTAD domain-containing putative transcriptional regulator [Streptomyces sp. NPDC101112]|uniref:AfsR/SARP family transcriptional regulator n=1 Tax=Streptomyces sp. NPDC101112 TaxID=3366105 RepID=UPI00380C58D6
MNIQLLGCIEVRTTSDRKIAMSHGARLLLAALAWSPNDFVTDEVMIERVWHERAPQYPRGALYTLATRLRKACAVAGHEGTGFLLERRRGGYVLVLDEARVDASRFRLLARAAKRAAHQAEDDRALRLYEEALSLWKGEPLSDVRTAWADAARVTLRQEHREVLVGSIELSLRLGLHEEHVTTLYALAAELPYDEKVVGLLMLALYRSGRQHEALDCFRLFRMRMIEQLGDGPGRELCSLQERILRRDPDLRLPRALLVMG